MSADLPLILVEGSDDQHVITQLLMKHQIVAHAVRPGSDLPVNVQVLIQQAGSKEGILKQMSVRLKSPQASVGFVLDADVPGDDQKWDVSRTWQSACGHLSNAGVDVSEPLLDRGFLGPVRNLQDRERHMIQAGVWIMPDNILNGTLEDFLESLIDPNDRLWQFAKQSTQAASLSHDATFLPKDWHKAELAAWLSWQDPPGLPYGVAVKRTRFQHDALLAQRFVDWVKQLMGAEDGN